MIAEFLPKIEIIADRQYRMILADDWRAGIDVGDLLGVATEELIYTIDLCIKNDLPANKLVGNIVLAVGGALIDYVTHQRNTTFQAASEIKCKGSSHTGDDDVIDGGTLLDWYSRDTMQKGDRDNASEQVSAALGRDYYGEDDADYQMMKMVAEGHSQAEAAKKFGLSPATVSRTIKAWREAAGAERTRQQQKNLERPPRI